MTEITSIQRVVALRSNVIADVSVGEEIDTISFRSAPQAWQILLGGLLKRDDFQALLTLFSGQVVYGIDYEAYEIGSQHTEAFLMGINLLIEKHFPKSLSQ